MTSQRQIPSTLSVVSYVFLAFGILAVIETIGHLMNHSVNVDLNILGLWIFAGLRRYSTGWRTCALVFIWPYLLGCPILFFYGIFGHGTGYLAIFGRPYVHLPAIWTSYFAAASFALQFWMYRTLTRPNIRGLFYVEPPTPVI